MKIDSVNHALASFEGGESAADALKRSPGGAESAFESMLLKKMVSSMRKTVPESGLWSGVTGQQMYDHFIEQALSDHLSDHGGIGIAQLLQSEASQGQPAPAEEFSDERLMRQNFDLYASKSHTKEEPEDVFDEPIQATSDTIDHDGPGGLSATLPPQRDHWLESPSAHQKLRALLEEDAPTEELMSERF